MDHNKAMLCIEKQKMLIKLEFDDLNLHEGSFRRDFECILLHHVDQFSDQSFSCIYSYKGFEEQKIMLSYTADETNKK